MFSTRSGFDEPGRLRGFHAPVRVGSRMVARAPFGHSGFMDSTFTFLMVSVGSFFGLASVVTVMALRRATIGHEDERGFHLEVQPQQVARSSEDSRLAPEHLGLA